MVFTIFFRISLKCNAMYSGIRSCNQTNIQGVCLMTSNQIAYLQAMESQRHNQVTEAEVKRSNLANEAINTKNAESNRTSATGHLLSGITGFLF